MQCDTDFDVNLVKVRTSVILIGFHFYIGFLKKPLISLGFRLVRPFLNVGISLAQVHSRFTQVNRVT